MKRYHHGGGLQNKKFPNVNAQSSNTSILDSSPLQICDLLLLPAVCRSGSPDLPCFAAACTVVLSASDLFRSVFLNRCIYRFRYCHCLFPDLRGSATSLSASSSLNLAHLRPIFLVLKHHGRPFWLQYAVMCFPCYLPSQEQKARV